MEAMLWNLQELACACRDIGIGDKIWKKMNHIKGFFEKSVDITISGETLLVSC